MGFSAVTIYSADGGGALVPSNLGVRQALYGSLGLVLMLLVASIDYRILGSLSWAIYGAAMVALVLVLIPGIGIEIAGSRRWFDLGFTTIQPSEFAKIATLLALSSFVASRGAATPVIVFFAWEFLLAEYQRRRWTIFLNPEVDARGDGFNLIQARISIGSGGLRGFGIEGGTQSQLGLLKVRESDFIFAHASGMFGFIGMLALMLMFAILLWRCLHVSEVARDELGQALAIGVTGMLFFQAFVNIGMNIGLMPVTGITLPFISSGLSSLWTFLIAEGILQSILIRQRKLAFQPD